MIGHIPEMEELYMIMTEAAQKLQQKAYRNYPFHTNGKFIIKVKEPWDYYVTDQDYDPDIITFVIGYKFDNPEK